MFQWDDSQPSAARAAFGGASATGHPGLGVVAEGRPPWQGPPLLRKRSTFLSEAWLEGEPPGASAREQCVAGQHQIQLGARIAAQLDLAFGHELALFRARWRISDLGHSRPEDFANERLDCSWSHAQEIALVSKRLETLPTLRAAFLAGALSYSRVRAVIRGATPDNERGWTHFARGRSVREIQQAIAAWRKRGRGDAPSLADDAPSDEVRVKWRASRVQKAIFDGWGMKMGRDILGWDAPKHVVAEAVAAEALTSFEEPRALPDAASAVAEGATSASPSAKRRRTRMSPRDLKRHARRRMLLETPRPIELPTSEGVTDAAQHLAILQQLQQLRHGLDWERTRVLSVFLDRRLYRVLGLTEQDFVAYVLGIAPKDASQCVYLQSRVAFLPEVAETWREGEISQATAWKLVRAAIETTQHAWIEQASLSSRKRLEAEVNWHVAVRGMLGWDRYHSATGGVPLKAPQSVEAFEMDWRELFGVRERVRRERRASRTDGESAPDDDAGPAGDEIELELDIDAIARREPLVTCGFDAPPEVADLWWRAMLATREAMHPVATDGEVVTRMLVEFAQSNFSPEIEEHLADYRIFERDGWRCTTPHCRSHGPLHAHHIIFRSHGGPDDGWNLTTLCDRCHELVHAGKLRITGRAPDGLLVEMMADSTGHFRERWHGGMRLPPEEPPPQGLRIPPMREAHGPLVH